MTETKPLSLKNIAIIRLSSLGDIIHTLPAFQVLRTRFPETGISWFAEPAGARLLKNFSGIDEIIVVDLKKQKLRENIHQLKTLLKLHRRRFDRVIDFQGLLKSALLAWLLKCESIGFHRNNLKEALAAHFYTRQGEEFDEKRHVIQKNLELLTVLGIRQAPIEYPRMLDAEKNLVPQFMRKHRLVPGRFIILNIGGGWPSKILNLEQNLEIVNRLKDKYPLVLLWGNERERKLADRISRSTCIPLTVFFEFHELFDFIRQSRLVITADTLALHAADMVNTPSVGIFGPTDPNRNGSLLAESRSVFLQTDCSFCYKKKCDTMKCLRHIDIAEIERSVNIIHEKHKRNHH